MIVYNVGRRWFTMKADAERYRVDEKLPPPALFKLDIIDRDDLAGLLNALCGWQAPVAPLMDTLPAKVVEDARVAPWDPEYDTIVPLFLRRQEARKLGIPEPTV